MRFKPVSSFTETCCGTKTSLFRYGTFRKANNKGADQSARMRRLVCAFVGCQPPKTGFLASWPLMMAVLSRDALIYECMYYSLVLEFE